MDRIATTSCIKLSADEKRIETERLERDGWDNVIVRETGYDNDWRQYTWYGSRPDSNPTK